MTYEEMVRNLKKDSTEIRPNRLQIDRLHMILGLAGEVGELVDTVKKNVIYNQDLDIVNVIEELGDIEFYLEGFRQAVYVSRKATLNANMDKLGRRYAEGYSDAAAKERIDKS